MAKLTTTLKTLFVLLLSSLLLWPLKISAEVTSYAIVRNDASLKVQEYVFRLYGVYFPRSTNSCQRQLQPNYCNQAPVSILNSIIKGFVSCYGKRKNSDGSIAAICVNNGVDLGAYLIENGVAMATSYAPENYHALERLAQHQGRGMWGPLVVQPVSPYYYPYSRY